jgi:hypothetical protein
MSTLDAVRARFARNDGLPFADILTEASIRNVLNDHGVEFRDRVFNPVTTIWGFLSQVLSEDHSGRDAVSRIIAHRSANGMTVCSPNTASYCDARSRICTAARPVDRVRLIDAMLTTIAYHRVGDRPGRWEPRARKRRPKPAARLTQPRHTAKLEPNRSKWF